MTYSVTGTLNMADLSLQLPHVQQAGIVNILAMMFLVSFGIKAAIFPLFFWLPTSYHTPPISVTAIFAGLLTKVGVYALIRVFTLLFVHDIGFTHKLILILAALTMTSGVLGAIAQNEFRRILSYHIISQIGYMLIGLGLYTPLALAGSIFYIVHHIIVKTNLFLVSGVVYRLRNTYNLDNLGGLYRSSPIVSGGFFIAALSLSGIPPLSGFWSKFILVRAGFEVGNYWIIGVALFVGLFSLYSMMKIWREVFLKNPPVSVEYPEKELPDLPMLLPIVILATITVLIGLSANPIFNLAQDAANQLFDTSEYIQAVLEVR
jgi:multicomponent Na+:H+ antiporter subunit D